MELTPYVERLRHELTVAAEGGGEQVRLVADRLTASMDSAVRLMLLEALSAAADEVTRELAPGSVELRLRGGEPDFAVVPPPSDEPADPATDAPAPAPAADEDDSAIARINLRLPEALKAGVEEAASRERLSTNAWLVRLVAAAIAAPTRGSGPRQGSGRVGQAYTGWVR